MKRTWSWWAGLALVFSFGALFIGVGVFELCVGYAFSRHGTVARSGAPFSYWLLTGWWFVFGLFCIVKGIRGYLEDDAKLAVSDDDPSSP